MRDIIFLVLFNLMLPTWLLDVLVQHIHSGPFYAVGVFHYADAQTLDKIIEWRIHIFGKIGGTRKKTN